MGIVIRVLIYSLIAFLMYLMLDGEKKIAAFAVNIIGLFVYYCITNGFNHIFEGIIYSTILGILFGIIGSYLYGKFDSLNKYLGTTILIEMIMLIALSGIITIFKIIIFT